MAQHSASAYELARNEVLVRAAQFSSQYNVDLSLILANRDEVGVGATMFTSGAIDTTMERVQKLPVAETLTQEQVLRQHRAGALALPIHDAMAHWAMVGRQGGWVQLRAPSGQMVQLPSLRPPGYLDKAHHPVSPRSEAAYASLAQELDGLCELASAQAARKRRRTAGNPAGAAELGAAVAGGDDGIGAGLQAVAQRLAGMGEGVASPVEGLAGGRGGPSEGGAGGSGIKASRFKALSVEVPHQQVVAARPGATMLAGTQNLEHNTLMLNTGPDGLTLPSPSGLLTSGPQTLGSMMAQFGQGLDLLPSTRGQGPGAGVPTSGAAGTLGVGQPILVGPSPRGEQLLVAGQLGRPQHSQQHKAEGVGGAGGGGGVPRLRVVSEGGSGLLEESANVLATPNSSQLNGFMKDLWSPVPSGGTGAAAGKAEAGGNSGGLMDEEGDEASGSQQDAQDLSGLVVLGRGVDKATLKAMESSAAAAVQAGGSGGEARPPQHQAVGAHQAAGGGPPEGLGAPQGGEHQPGDVGGSAKAPPSFDITPLDL